MGKIKIGKIDSRLLDASIELDALEEHLQLIESQMAQIRETARNKTETYIRKEGLCPDDPEWQSAWQYYDYRIDSLPIFFRGTFLVVLYAAYESIVNEIARLIQDKQSQKKKINDLKGDFLERAKKYYKHILKFDLYSDEKVWQQVRMLSTLRNAFAHANGRLDMLTPKPRRIIQNWTKQKRGISTDYGYIICEANIVADIFGAVRSSLKDLIERYKDWNDQQAHITNAWAMIRNY